MEINYVSVNAKVAQKFIQNGSNRSDSQRNHNDSRKPELGLRYHIHLTYLSTLAILFCQGTAPTPLT